MAYTINTQIFFLAFLLILITLAHQAETRSLHEPSMLETHEQWMARYGRVYANSTEKEKRSQIFKANVNYIESFNKEANKPYKLGLTEFTDLTNEEFKLRNGFKGHGSSTANSSFKYGNVSDVPANMDWREKGAVTAIKDQGSCGKLFSARL